VRTIRNTDTQILWAVRTFQETLHVTATEPNRLMLFRETVAVYCENHTELTDTICVQNAVYTNSARASQKTHHVSATNAVWGNIRCLLLNTIRNTQIHCVCRMQSFTVLKESVYILTTVLRRVK
jgi:hypothetical protein